MSLLTEFLWCWWLNDDDSFEIFKNRQFDRLAFWYNGDFFNVKNQPPTFQTVTVVLVTSWFSSYSCHLHISSPISVTNIDVSQSSIFHWISNLHYDQKENNLNFKISNTVWMQLTVRLLLWIVNLHYRHLFSDK